MRCMPARKCGKEFIIVFQYTHSMSDLPILIEEYSVFGRNISDLSAVYVTYFLWINNNKSVEYFTWLQRISLPMS